MKRFLLISAFLLTFVSCSGEAQKLQGDLMQKKDELTNSAANSLQKAQEKVQQGKEAVDSVQNAINKVDALTK